MHLMQMEGPPRHFRMVGLGCQKSAKYAFSAWGTLGNRSGYKQTCFYPLSLYNCIGKAWKYRVFVHFGPKTTLNSHINLNKRLSGILWTYSWPSKQFSKFPTSMRVVCGPQKGVNWAQNDDFSHFMTVWNNLSGCTWKDVNANLERIDMNNKMKK